MNAEAQKVQPNAKYLLLATLLLVGAILIGFSIAVARDAAKVQNTWNEFETLRSPKALYLLELNSALGYDGLIHHLKNLILRQEELYHNRFHESLGMAIASTQRYLEQNLDQDERRALENIRIILQQFADAATVVEHIHLDTFSSNTQHALSKSRSPHEVDKLISIIDTPLIDGLALLNDKLWKSLNNEQNSNKTILLSQIRSTIGYNGVIHHYKDYILHGDPSTLEKAKLNFQATFRLLHQYQILELSDAEYQAIDQLSKTFYEYYEALLKAVQLHRQRLDNYEIDRQLKIQDDDSSAALQTLAQEISLNNQRRAQHVDLSLTQILTASKTGIALTSFSIILLLITHFWTQRDRIRYEHSIELAQRRMGAILDNTADAIIVTDSKGFITEYNHAAEKMFGYDSQDIIGKNIRLIMQQNHADKHDKYIENYHKTNVAKVIGIGRETVGRHKSGKEFPVNLSIGKSVVNGEIAFTGILRNISAEHRLRQELIAAKNNAEAASNAKSQFLASMSHELRTPLNAIIGLSQLLATDTNSQLDEQAIEALHDIHHSGKHLLNLINDILDYARIENNSMALQCEDIRINGCINIAISMVQPQAIKQNIRIQTQFDDDLPTVFADELRTRQVIINLLSNAIKYNVEHGEVLITASRHADNLRIGVRDTGNGIPLNKQNELFQPFKRLGQEGSHIEGTGIGLSIAQTLVKLMHGTMGFKSAPGQGSTFWFDLPISSSIPHNKNCA